jgi:hypothetical protein
LSEFQLKLRERIFVGKTILAIDEEQSGENIGEIIDHLIHEMENHLQVISMEAHLRREPKCILDAAENIEKLLGKVKQHFLVSR